MYKQLNGRRKNVMQRTAIYGQQITCIDIDKPGRQCYKESGSTGKYMKEKVDNKECAFTWQKQQESNTTR